MVRIELHMVMKGLGEGGAGIGIMSVGTATVVLTILRSAGS